MTSAAPQVVLAVSKPGEKGDIPVGVIAGSVIAGLVLLALAVGLLWKVQSPSFHPSNIHRYVSPQSDKHLSRTKGSSLRKCIFISASEFLLCSLAFSRESTSSSRRRPTTTSRANLATTKFCEPERENCRFSSFLDWFRYRSSSLVLAKRKWTVARSLTGGWVL